MTDLPDGFTYSSETARMDRDVIHRWLSEEAYWALGRSREVQDTAVDASRNFGIFDASGTQVAYARAVTDGATFAWFCDVYVDVSARGLGLGKVLVERAFAELDRVGLPRILLATSTAHELYRRYGFEAVPDGDWLIRFREKKSGLVSG